MSSFRASNQDHAKMPAKLRMNVIRSRYSDNRLRIMVSHVALRLSHLLCGPLSCSAIASPAFAQEKSRDLATFLSGHLTASGQFQNYHDGSTRGVRVDIHGAPVGGAFKLIEDTVYSDGEKRHTDGDSRRSAMGGTSASAPI
jgi:hypothetical protein